MRLAQTLAFGVALLGSGVALAQPAAPPPAALPGRPAPGARMFEQMDANRDGRVTWEEAWAFATSRFNTADADRSGGLTLQEFGAMRLIDAPPGRRAPSPEQAARMEQRRAAMFRALDANSDGMVTLAEMQPPAQARFRAMDANADGAITREELPRHGRGDHHPGHRGERGERGAPAAPAAPAR